LVFREFGVVLRRFTAEGPRCLSGKPTFRHNFILHLCEDEAILGAVIASFANMRALAFLGASVSLTVAAFGVALAGCMSNPNDKVQVEQAAEDDAGEDGPTPCQDPTYTTELSQGLDDYDHEVYPRVTRSSLVYLCPHRSPWLPHETARGWQSIETRGLPNSSEPATPENILGLMRNPRPPYAMHVIRGDASLGDVRVVLGNAGVNFWAESTSTTELQYTSKQPPTRSELAALLLGIPIYAPDYDSELELQTLAQDYLRGLLHSIRVYHTRNGAVDLRAIALAPIEFFVILLRVKGQEKAVFSCGRLGQFVKKGLPLLDLELSRDELNGRVPIRYQPRLFGQYVPEGGITARAMPSYTGLDTITKDLPESNRRLSAYEFIYRYRAFYPRDPVSAAPVVNIRRITEGHVDVMHVVDPRPGPDDPEEFELYRVLRSFAWDTTIEKPNQLESKLRAHGVLGRLWQTHPEHLRALFGRNADGLRNEFVRKYAQQRQKIFDQLAARFAPRSDQPWLEAMFSSNPQIQCNSPSSSPAQPLLTEVQFSKL